ncbi:MAG: hypothetical protein PF495_20095, partial [Spirochaetales bacterium]|nr:hypothetical protein [Spirochaetales bacterium]
TRKKSFVNGFEHFGKKAIVMFIVKKCKLFEAVKPSSCILGERLNCAQNGHEVNKIDFLRVHQGLHKQKRRRTNAGCR